MTYVAIYNDNYLAHHGVKGMKWGVRRSRTARLYSEGSGRRARGSSSSGEMTAEQRSARRRKIAKGIAIGVGSAAAAAGLAYAGSKYLKSRNGQLRLPGSSTAIAKNSKLRRAYGTAMGRMDAARKAGNYANAAKGFASTAKNTAKTYAKSSNIARAAGDARKYAQTAMAKGSGLARAGFQNTANFGKAVGRYAKYQAGAYGRAADAFAREVAQNNRKRRRR